MKRNLVLLLVASVQLISQAVLAQSKDPVTSVVREILPRQQKNIVAAAEEMPSGKFDFKPTPAQLSFGHLILHIAESNNYLCAKLSDAPAPKPSGLTETSGKEKLVAALKASFDLCSVALQKVDDSKLGEEIDLFNGRSASRAFALIALTNDWADHYGSEAMYLRLNDLLPPTAQPKK
jgi:hypothetical protein